MAPQHACRLALKAFSSDAVSHFAEETIVPLFMIERNFAEALEGDPDPETAATIKQVNDEIGIQWLFSFLSADKRKTYCLYEAPNPEAIRVAARRLGVPADTIVEVGSEIGPLAAAIAPLREQVGADARPPA
jgi:Protein of unknown function (DUF4242)